MESFLVTAQDVRGMLTSERADKQDLTTLSTFTKVAPNMLAMVRGTDGSS